MSIGPFDLGTVLLALLLIGVGVYLVSKNLRRKAPES